jgi:hypothetical protein
MAYVTAKNHVIFGGAGEPKRFLSLTLAWSALAQNPVSPRN